MNKNLFDLISRISVSDTFGQAPDSSYSISCICMDSRTVIPHALFVCIKGYLSDGHAYASSAYDRGARVFVVERELSLPEDAYQLLVADARETLALLSAAYYGDPAKRMRVIGLTGTKGKTTTALYLRSILEEAGIPTGYIGTNGIIYRDVYLETANSTPESLILQKNLYDMAEAGVQAVVLEVSSQGLWMHRVDGLSFDACIFTNLSDDHVGEMEHPDMAHYMACKKLLFSKYSHQNTLVVCNVDDPASAYMTQGIAAPVVGVSTAPEGNARYVGYDITAQQPSYGLATAFRCRIGDKVYPKAFTIPTAGEFNVKNALCALAVACESFGITPETALRTLSHTHVEGRFETFVFPSLPGVKFVIDYAHNGLSMASALDALRPCVTNRLICVFGSVGCRSKGRRVELAVAAGPRADLCILTSDNPASENPLEILKEIDAGFPEGSCPRELIPDRRKAIAHAVDIAEAGDVILLAGKGHEHTQVIHGETLPYNERETLESIIFQKDGSLCDKIPF